MLVACGTCTAIPRRPLLGTCVQLHVSMYGTVQQGSPLLLVCVCGEGEQLYCTCTIVLCTMQSNVVQLLQVYSYTVLAGMSWILSGARLGENLSTAVRSSSTVASYHTIVVRPYRTVDCTQCRACRILQCQVHVHYVRLYHVRVSIVPWKLNAID